MHKIILAALAAMTIAPAASAEGWKFRKSTEEDTVCTLTAPGDTWNTTGSFKTDNSRRIANLLVIEYAGGHSAATVIFKNASSAGMIVNDEFNHRAMPGEPGGGDFWVEVPNPSQFAGFLIKRVLGFSSPTGQYNVGLDPSDHDAIKRWASCVKKIGG